MQTSFLQSYAWEKMQEALGRKSWRVSGYLVIRYELRGGFNYLYAPHLPECTEEFLHTVKDIAAREGSLFLKVDPAGDPAAWVSAVSGQRSSHFLQPRKTVVLDLTQPDEALLKAMHPKTRYNIRLAERKEVHVFKCDRVHLQHFVDRFWEMLSNTAARDAFRPHSRHYYAKLLAASDAHFYNNLFFAEYRGEMLATALVNYYGRQATYLHGASADVHREKMAPYLLHWSIVQDARQCGMASYDLWGIDERRWPGVTRFKMGFGGKVVEYPRAFDIVFRPVWYRAYRAARKIL